MTRKLVKTDFFLGLHGMWHRLVKSTCRPHPYLAYDGQMAHNSNLELTLAHPAKPWKPFTRYAVPYVTLYCILHESIIKLQFSLLNLCFLSELFSK